MTVEIRELIIRAVVEGGADEEPDKDAGYKSAGNSTGDEKIVAEAVEQTLTVLAMEKER